MEKCSAETVYKLSQKLGVSMETLLEEHLNKRISFELFKSNVCHQVLIAMKLQSPQGSSFILSEKSMDISEYLW